MRRLAIVALLLWVRPAHADETEADAQPRPAVPYWLHGTLDGPMAKVGMRFRLDVREGFNNTFDLDLPDHGVVTAATITVDKQQHVLTLDSTDHANAAFEAVTTAAAGAHRQWAVQVTPSLMASGIEVSVAAPHDVQMVIDVSVEAPACFHHDARYIAVPTTWRGSIDRSLKLIGEQKLDPCTQLELDPDQYGARLWIAMPTSEASQHPFGEQRISTSATRVDVTHGHFARVEVALANQISHVPADLYTVFVIDASRSVSGAGLETEAQLVLSYMKHAPQTQIQVIAYSRKARALLPGFMMASLATPRLERELAALQTANGSNVDIGLVEAGTWLAHVDGTRRVVLFSDQHLGDRVDGIGAPALRDSLPSGTLVHVVAIDDDESTFQRALTRDDDIAFAHVAIDSEGAALRGRTDDEGHIDALQLVRPIALEHVVLKTPSWKPLEVDRASPSCPIDGSADLAEGSGCVWWGDGEANAGAIQLEGLLWNHEVRRALVPTESSRMLARMLTGFHATLDAAEKEIRIAAHAVNEEWSLIATWGGSDGYADEEGFGMTGVGYGCSGGSRDIGIGSGTSGMLGRQGSIADQISRATQKCHVTSQIEIDLELTLDEIVDVAVTAQDPTVRACVTEAVWDVPLALTNPSQHDRTTVVVGS
jgi:hypothetical protein